MITEKSEFQQSGWLCQVCRVKTKIFNDTETPAICPSCGQEGQMKMIFNQFITTTTNIELLPLK